jgi:hypothetical protein
MMVGSKPSEMQINVNSVAIKDAPAGISSTRLDRAVREGLGKVLGGPDPTGGLGHSADIPLLRLRLPPQTTEAQIAEALVIAIGRSPREEQV